MGWLEKQAASEGVRVISGMREHLERQGVTFEPIAHKQTYTSIAEARALGINATR